MPREFLMLMIVLAIFAPAALAQNCNGANGAPLSGQNLDAYTAVGYVTVQSEGPTGTFTCTMNITVPRYQPVVVLQYLESWFWANPNFENCMNGVGYCQNTITVNLSGPGISDTETFTADGLARPPGGASPPWVLLSNAENELWGRTVIKTVDVSGATQFSDATLQFSVTDIVPQGSFEGSASGIFSAGGSIDILDPVPDLQDGNQILADPDSLATLGKLVIGIAADGAARVVLRIRAAEPGQSITLALLNDQGAVSTSAIADGTLATLDGTPVSGQVQLTAVSTLEGPMAFALYEPPIDFDRRGTDPNGPGIDDNSASRTVNFQVMSVSGPPNLVTPPFTIWRPPVILVHGLWGDPSDWDNFTPFLGNSRQNILPDPRFSDSQFQVHRANYNYPTNNALSDVMPFSLFLSRAHTNSLGFGFNAPLVLDQIQTTINDFRQARQAAATQVDVVAHSMGGTIVRTLEYLSGYTDTSSFGLGNVHKLVTIGTPHLGSPLANQLLQDTCVRNAFAFTGRFAITTATVSGVPATGGGVGDLQGSGFNDGSQSQALMNIQNPTPHEVPTLPIAGIMIAAVNPPSNTSDLACPFPCKAAELRKCPGSALAANLSPLGWPAVFGAPPNNKSDAIVPLNSQLNGVPSPLQVIGIVHSAGLEDLDFTGPGELDPLEGMITIQTIVISALNASVHNSTFLTLP